MGRGLDAGERAVDDCSLLGVVRTLVPPRARRRVFRAGAPEPVPPRRLRDARDPLDHSQGTARADRGSRQDMVDSTARVSGSARERAAMADLRPALRDAAARWGRGALDALARRPG